ncbi:MAG TPA: ATP-binding protein [Gammaproteobacteria bacterium]
MAAADTLAERAAPARQDASHAAADDFAWRVLILLNLFRLALSLVLFGVYSFATDPRIVGGADPALAWRALVGLLAFGVISLVLLHTRSPGIRFQTYFQFAADLASLTVLTHASGGVDSGLAGLLVVTVGALALLVEGREAFLLAAVAALTLLAEQLFAELQGLTTVQEFVPAGVLGAVIFVITGVVQLLRKRIVATELLAEQRGVDLRNLVELNEYIIQHLRESIVVVDGEDRVRLINASACQHLGASTDVTGRELATISEALAERLRAWRADASFDRWTSAFAARDGATTIQPHFAPLGADREGGVLIFLEDTSLIEERVQQVKLAALGRLSASIAHEIRNPIGAMSHAGQLLAESTTLSPEDLRLTDIIRVNAQRVSQIVESVLTLSRRGKTRRQRLNLADWLDAFAREYTQTLDLYEGAVTVSAPDRTIEAPMDPTHLHQVVWNLCDNAVKYASAAAGAISVELSCGVLETSNRPYLEVADRGPGIPPELAEQVFEPFFTGQPGGTGLGLYISKELCERNGATLRYRPRPGGGSAFRVIFADPDRWLASEEPQ